MPLPCNVVVRQAGGTVVVEAMDPGPMATMVTTTSWSEIRARRPTPAANEAAADEARITAFR